MTRRVLALVAPWLLAGCVVDGGVEQQGSLKVVVTAVDGASVPTADAPLPANVGDHESAWTFTVEAVGPDGQVDQTFNAVARVSVVPGAVNRVEGEGVGGRNVRFVNGHAEGVAMVTATFGASRLWVEDRGYVPAPLGATPRCANGVDDDGDVAVDYPTDPGCAFADDDSEEPGTFLTGVSQVVHFARPTVADVQGRGSATPYPAVAIDIKTDDPNYVVVTRVASDGFYVTDLGETGGYGHVYAFNFNTPAGMRVCDRLSYFSGTASEFFGFTEVTFPSFEVIQVPDDECLAPEPTLLDDDTIGSDAAMERLESGLVRLEGFSVARFFGPEPAISNAFNENASSCDLNADGVVDFLDEAEGNCANACSESPDCSEWISYASRGNYKVQKDGVMMQVNTNAVTGFNPLDHRGEVLAAVTGTLRNFSGGALNWTVETRCGDDLSCTVDPVCKAEPVPSTVACVAPRTQSDNDSGSN